MQAGMESSIVWRILHTPADSRRARCSGERMGNKSKKEQKQSEPKSSPQNQNRKKPKQEITIITNSLNTIRIYGQTSAQIFPERWPLSNPN